MLLTNQSWNVLSYLFNGNMLASSGLHDQLLEVVNELLLNLLLGVKSFTMVIVQFEYFIIISLLDHSSVKEGSIFLSIFKPLYS